MRNGTQRLNSIGCLAIFAIVGMALTTGCAVDQKKEVALYKDVVRIDGDDAPFTPGQPITLRDALLLANQNNERLALEGETFVQALINRRRAVAAFLPTVDLAGGYSFQNADDFDGSIGIADSSEATAVGNINLFNGFRDVAALKSATQTIEQRRALLLEVQETLLLDVAQVYYQILRAQRSVEVLRNSLRVQDERVRDARGRRDAGVARPLDVALTESRASATRVSLLAAENDVVNGRVTLAFLTGAPVEDSPLTDHFLLGYEILPVNQLLAIAVVRRTDLQAADAGARAARQDVEVAFGQYYPSVSLNLNYLAYRDPDSSVDWTALLRANLPIFSAGLIEADVRTAWSRFRQAVTNRQFIERQIYQDVRLGYQNVIASRQRLSELDVQLVAAQEAFRQAEQSYNVGLATNLERLAAQDQLLTAQLQLASEQYDQKVFYLNLLRSTGSIREEAILESTTTQPVETTIDPSATTNPAATQTPDFVPKTPATAPAR